jgi:glycerol-3-phosphate acyltransferase PlsY
MPHWLVILIGYLFGTLPTAYIAGRVLKGDDIHHMGDGNVGAANAYRELGPKTGLLVAFIDAGKGALAILIAQASGASQIVVMFTGLAAIIGHNWPVFIGFRGGRGESTAIGVLLMLVTLPMLILAVPALIALFWRKNVILASIVLFVPLSLVEWLTGTNGSLIVYSIALPCLVGFTHFIRTRPKAINRIEISHTD